MDYITDSINTLKKKTLGDCFDNDYFENRDNLCGPSGYRKQYTKGQTGHCISHETFGKRCYPAGGKSNKRKSRRSKTVRRGGKHRARKHRTRKTRKNNR
jgi:hypothetical protein